MPAVGGFVVVVLLISGIALAVLLTKRYAERRTEKQRNQLKMHVEILTQLINQLYVEFENKTVEEAVNHIRTTRPNFRILIQSSVGNSFWNANEGYTIVFHGKLTDSSFKFTVGYNAASITALHG